MRLEELYFSRVKCYPYFTFSPGWVTMEPQIRFCTSAGGVRIAYATLGEGPPLVFVPSWADGLEPMWQHPLGHAWIERLSEGRLFVSFDRRGVGASLGKVDDLSLEAQVAEVAAVVDHLGLAVFDLFGCTDGSEVIVAYAARHPERVSRLVLWSPYPRGEEIIDVKAARALVELIRSNWGLARRAIADLVYPSGPTELQRWFSNFLRQSASPEAAARYTEFMASVDIRSFLPQVQARTLILHRSHNKIVPISAGRAAAALLPDARLIPLEGDIDLPMHGDISYLETLTQFLAEEPAPGGATALGRGAVASYLDGLTQRELEVLRLVAAGKSNQGIAEELVISVNTVERHVSNILTKTDTSNRTEAAAYAARYGVLS